jgi:hypothetical protein
MEMSTYDLPQESKLIVKSRKAAYCARRRLNGADLTAQDMEDMIQAAAMACWKHHTGFPIDSPSILWYNADDCTRLSMVRLFC